MSVRRYRINYDGSFEESEYGGLVRYEDYLSLLKRYNNREQSIIELFMITYINGGTRSHTAPQPYSQIVEILEKYLNDSEYQDVKVYAVKLAKIETSSKVSVIDIRV